MPQVLVKNPFLLVRENGTETPFKAGMQEVAQEDLDHPYVQANLIDGNFVAPKVGSYEFHSFHPSTIHFNNHQDAILARETMARAQEDAEIAEARSKSARERAKQYSDELMAIVAPNNTPAEPTVEVSSSETPAT